jgi:hypothetical protein
MKQLIKLVRGWLGVERHRLKASQYDSGSKWDY